MVNLCYNFKKLEFNQGLLDNCIDVTYIIHLEGNGRLEHIYEQLNKFHITKKVFILFRSFTHRGRKGQNKITTQTTTITRWHFEWL